MDEKLSPYTYKLTPRDSSKQLKGTFHLRQLKLFNERDLEKNESPVIQKFKTKPNIVRPPADNSFHMNLRSRK